MSLEKIGCIYEGAVNDVYICCDSEEDRNSQRVLLLVKDREVARTMAGFTGFGDVRICADKKGIGWIVPYQVRRPILTFYQGENWSLEERQFVWRNCVAGCMASRIPRPVLYLMLKQGQMNLDAGRRIYFSWYLNLEELNTLVTEMECVDACARILVELMEQTAKKDRICLELLKKKIKRKAYRKFEELMLDLQYGGGRKGRCLSKKRLCVDEKQEHKYARVLFVVAAVLFSLAVIFFVSQLVFGDIPFFRIMGNSLERIGSESLRQ